MPYEIYGDFEYMLTKMNKQINETFKLEYKPISKTHTYKICI